MSKTEAWKQYEQGVDYKNEIGLYTTVDLNERFFAGDQWVGIPHEGLPTPVVNFIKYASAWKIAAVTDRRLELSFFAEGESDGSDIGVYAKQLSDYCDKLWERMNMDYMTKEGLKQAAITGDYVQYFYWDDKLMTGQALTGDIATMLVDNVNYYPGNPNDPDVQSQPYIIIAFRELMSKVKLEAKANKCRSIDDIKPDDETDYTSGDMGKIELGDNGKCNVLLKMWKEDGRVYCEKCTRDVVIQPKKDTKLTRYPVALMNWDTRKNCCHGTAEVTGLIPNQVFVNKILALSQLSQVQTSFPKVIFDKTRIKQWSNKVAGAIPVSGDIDGAARYMSPPGVSYDAWRGLDVTIDQTMRMMRANDVTLGNISNPDNTSAFIATRDAAMVPLQTQQERFYAFIEDIGRIWLDFIQQFYKAGRKIPVEHDGVKTYVPLQGDELEKYTLNLRVDVGPSTMWSEIQMLQTLDNLLANGQITLKQYLERIPEGHIPAKDKLIEELMAAEGGAGPGMPEGAMPPELAAMMGSAPDAGAGMPPEAKQPVAVPPELAAMIGGAPEGGAGSGMPPKEKPPEGIPPELAAMMGGGAAPSAPEGMPPVAVPPELAEMIGGAPEGEVGAGMTPEGMPPKEKPLGAVPPEAKRSKADAILDAMPVPPAVAAYDEAARKIKEVIAKYEQSGLPQVVAEQLRRLIEQEAGKDELLAAVANAAKDGTIGDTVAAALEAAIQEMDKADAVLMEEEAKEQEV